MPWRQNRHIKIKHCSGCFQVSTLMLYSHIKWLKAGAQYKCMWQEILESLKCFRVLKKTCIIVKSNSDEKFLAPKNKRIGVERNLQMLNFHLNIFHLPCETEHWPDHEVGSFQPYVARHYACKWMNSLFHAFYRNQHHRQLSFLSFTMFSTDVMKFDGFIYSLVMFLILTLLLK